MSKGKSVSYILYDDVLDYVPVQPPDYADLGLSECKPACKPDEVKPKRKRAAVK